MEVFGGGGVMLRRSGETVGQAGVGSGLTAWFNKINTNLPAKNKDFKSEWGLTIYKRFKK